MSDAVPAACIIGGPFDHSPLPLVHNYWLKTYGIAGEYRREAVAPEHLGKFVRSLDARGYVGANVTGPHKQAVLNFSLPTNEARLVDAADTLWYDDSGYLRATDTGVEGFLRNLSDCAPGWNSGLDHAVVLGAGGAARAVIQGLLERHVPRITVINRTKARAMSLHWRYGERVQVGRWKRMNDLLGDAGLLINTTPLGMVDKPKLPADVRRLPSHAVVADLVYVPRMTPLLQAAGARGLWTADGLGVLLHQAVDGFYHWFGHMPKVTAELRAAVEAGLNPSVPQGRGIT